MICLEVRHTNSAQTEQPITKRDRRYRLDKEVCVVFHVSGVQTKTEFGVQLF